MKEKDTVATMLRIREDYWENFTVDEADIEFLYQYLLEVERPLASEDLARAIVEERLRREREAWEKRQVGEDVLYLPKERYAVGTRLVFPALAWRVGEVVAVRPGRNPDLGDFEVIRVRFEDGEEREFAAGLAQHALNEGPVVDEHDPLLNPDEIMRRYGKWLVRRLEEALREQEGFVRIAGRWFPRALLMEVHIGHLNLAEAVLDMAGGGPLPTREIMRQIDYPMADNPHLAEFSFDLALQEDERFDEVGPAGQVLWFLKRLEPEGVLNTPLWLQYEPLDYDRAVLSEEMLALEAVLDDELSPLDDQEVPPLKEVQVTLTFPHWRAGTLPLSARVRHLFPTAYEAPRIRFILVDGETGEEFPGWVVRQSRYVYGLGEWYRAKGLMPGCYVWVRPGAEPGKVEIRAAERRPTSEWVRTVMVGADGRLAFLMTKQRIAAEFDERMMLYVADPEALDPLWHRIRKERTPLEKTLVLVMRELAKLNPQQQVVHAAEVYAAMNALRRCPPGPILALLATRPWFQHVGDLYFRFEEGQI